MEMSAAMRDALRRAIWAGPAVISSPKRGTVMVISPIRKRSGRRERRKEGRFISGTGDEGLGAFNFLAYFDFDFGVKGQEEVNTGTEFDETALAALEHLFVWFGVAYDSAGNEAGDLAKENLLAVVVQYYGGVFVLFGGFGVRGYVEVTIMVFKVLNDTAYRIPVDVYVKDVHKNRYLNPAFF